MTDFSEALQELKDALWQYTHGHKDDKSERKVIRLFELAHEMALKTIGEYFRKQGRGYFSGSRDATVEAFNEELIDDGKGWLDMVIDRIQFNPVYQAGNQEELAEKIVHKYMYMLENFHRKMKERLEG